MPEDTPEKPMTPEQGPPDNSEFVAPPSPPTGGEGGPASPKSTDEGGPTPAEQREVDRAVRRASLIRARRVAEAKRRARSSTREQPSAQIGQQARESELYMAPIPPSHIVALFRQGRYGIYERAWQEKVDFFNIGNGEDRTKWAYLNMGVYNQGIIPGSERQWKSFLDNWIGDLKDATRLAKLSVWAVEEVEETEKEIIAMMAVSSAARAMEQSDGSAAAYAMMITQSTGTDPEIDKQDTWAKYLLANDPKKYQTLINMPLVNKYYKQVLEDAGINVSVECGQNRAKISKFVPKTTYEDIKRNSKLVGYLKTRGVNYKGGFDGYIRDVLLNGQEADEVNKSAAKLACDAFLVEKYTRWEYQLINGQNPDSEDDLRMEPSVSWGGDPFRMVLEPAFLPRRIKDVYKGSDKVILQMFDRAFRPTDIFQAELEQEAMIPTAVAHLKNFHRLNSAMWLALGGSTGSGIPRWDREMLEKNLGAIVDLLKQVYGNIDKPTTGTGRQIVGAMMMRLLECKALALAVESGRPGFREAMSRLFGKQEVYRPFYEVEQFLWGPNLDNHRGFIESLAGGRTRLVFQGNRYGAEKSLRTIWDILYSNDQDPRGRASTRTLDILGFLLDSIQSIARGGQRR